MFAAVIMLVTTTLAPGPWSPLETLQSLMTYLSPKEACAAYYDSIHNKLYYQWMKDTATSSTQGVTVVGTFLTLNGNLVIAA